MNDGFPFHNKFAEKVTKGKKKEELRYERQS